MGRRRVHRLGAWDEDIAKLAGQPDVIAHGVLTMGLGAGFASAWSGDPVGVTFPCWETREHNARKGA